MNLLTNPDRLTLTPLFLQYPWRSHQFVEDTWSHDPPAEGLEAFTKTLKQLDTAAYPPDTPEYGMFRAHLQLPTVTNHKVTDETISTSNAAYACWITLLRFQVLDLLLSLTYGVSKSPSPRQSAPRNESARSVSTS